MVKANVINPDSAALARILDIYLDMDELFALRTTTINLMNEARDDGESDDSDGMIKDQLALDAIESAIRRRDSTIVLMRDGSIRRIQRRQQ